VESTNLLETPSVAAKKTHEIKNYIPLVFPQIAWDFFFSGVEAKWFGAYKIPKRETL